MNNSLDEDGRERFHLLNIKDSYEGNYHGAWLGDCSINKLKNVRIFLSF